MSGAATHGDTAHCLPCPSPISRRVQNLPRAPQSPPKKWTCAEVMGRLTKIQTRKIWRSRFPKFGNWRAFPPPQQGKCLGLLILTVLLLTTASSSNLVVVEEEEGGERREKKEEPRGYEGNLRPDAGVLRLAAECGTM